MNDAYYDWLVAFAYDRIMEKLETADCRSGMVEFELDGDYHDLIDVSFFFEPLRTVEAIKRKLTDTGFTDVEVAIRFDDADTYFYVEYYVQ